MHSQALIAFYVLLSFSIGFALLRGGAPERVGAAIIVVTLAAELVARAYLPLRLHSVDPVAVGIDAAATVSFGALTLYARRAWPIWATSLQILSLSSHFAQGVDPARLSGIYILMKSVPTFLVLIVLALGTGFHLQRLRKRGSDPAWMEW